jgi:hypothetical protein
VVANVLLALSQHTRRGEVDAARGILATLARRIAAALAWPEAPLETWTDALSLLIARLRLPWSAPARLVYDLQKACLDHEREVFTIDVVGWIASLGTRPVRRPLPAQRLVRIVRSLRSAHQRLEGRNMAGLAKTPLDELLSSWVQRAEENLRAALRPRIVEALGRAGLLPDNVPETVARNKLVEELLDQAVAKGFLSLGSLRDAIARNDLKMPNLSGPRQWLVGDALLAADGELAVTLDGVYRQGELYLRGLQKVSSLFFGTRGGRWLTLYVILPLLGSFVILEGMQHLVGPLLHHALHRRVHLFTPVPFLLLAAYLFGLLHAEPVRRGTLRVARAVGATLRAVFVRLPVWLVTRPLVLRIARSAPVLFLWRYALKPLVWVTPWIALGKHQHWGPIPLAVGACVGFVLANVASNSKLGIRLEEAAFDLAARSWRNVTGHLLPGLVRYVLDLFQRLVDTIERGIYAVDERLRFRSGESVVAIYAKGLIGVVWFLATYLLRIYVNLLVEPQVNPVKHFPVVTVGHKLTLPMAPMLVEGLNGVLRVVLGPVVGGIMAGVTVLLLPGLFGFLAWELKENYRLYRQNRPKELGPILIGSHGETMLRLLRPGFHSGTLPKAYGKLRRAERRGAPSLLAREHALGHVEEAVRHFIERELVALLVASGHFGQLVVGPINLASNRIRVALECGEAGGAAVLAFEEQSGWILGSLTTLGFVEHLSAGERVVFETALAGLFKKAAVDIVREQLEAQLRGEHGIPAYDIADEGLVVWPDADLATEVVYALDGRNELQPTVREAQDTKGARTLQRNAVLYRETPLSWERWVGAWRGAGGIRVLSEPGT